MERKDRPEVPCHGIQALCMDPNESCHSRRQCTVAASVKAYDIGYLDAVYRAY